MNNALAAGLALLVIGAAGCATQPDKVLLLDEAHMLLQQVEADPLAATAGAEDLDQARSYLRAAEQDFRQGEDRDQVEHKAYLALRYAQIVRERMGDARVREQIERTRAERTELQLQARTREAQRRESGSGGR